MQNGLQKANSMSQILEVALKREREAYRFYDRLLSETKVGILKEILEQLRDEEQKHIRMIEKKIAQMNLGQG